MKIGNFEISIPFFKSEVRATSTPSAAVNTLGSVYRKQEDKLKKVEPLPKILQWRLATTTAILGNILLAIKSEIFRGGIAIRAKFVKKCKQCNTDYHSEVQQCSVCGGIDFIYPSQEERVRLEAFMEKVNSGNQSLIDLLEEIENDLNIFDDCYLVLKKQYLLLGGEIVSETVQEIYRGDPLTFDIVANKYGDFGKDDEGRSLMVCVFHREEVQKDAERCKYCGAPLKPAYYYSSYEDKRIYYTDGEVIHESKYNPSKTYGFSPINFVKRELFTIIGMKDTMEFWYRENRSPKMLLLFNLPSTQNPEEILRRVREEYNANPNNPVILAFHNPEGNEILRVYELMKNPEEMQLIEFMRELKREIASVYGVMPIFIGDISTSGGLNNEGLQIVVSGRAIERGLRVYNQKIFPQLMRQMGINDWTYEVVSVYNDAQKRRLEDLREQVEVALKIKELGFDIGFNPDTETFYIKQPQNNQIGSQSINVNDKVLSIGEKE